GRGADDLRHGESDRQAHGDRPGAADAEVRRAVRLVYAMRVLVAIYSPFASWCIPEAQVDWLRREFPQHTFTRADSDDETLARIGDAEVVFGATVRADQLAAARSLRWIHSPAAGIGNMLFPEMIASPVVMTNSRGNSAATIAEHTVGVTLALLRDLPLAMRRQTERVWA